MKLSLTILVLIAVTLTHCKLNNVAQTSAEEEAKEENSVEKFAEARFGKGFNLLWNNTESLVIITKGMEKKMQNPFPTLQLVIYDPLKNEMLWEDVVAKGKVSWLNDEEIEISSVPGMMTRDRREPMKTGYIYNCTKREKTSLK